MGNALSTARARKDGRAEDIVKLTVGEVARKIAYESIYSVVNEALTSIDYVAEMLIDASFSDPEDTDGDDVDVLDAIVRASSRIGIDLRQVLLDRVRACFKHIGSEKFTLLELHDAMIASGLVRRSAIDNPAGNIYRFDHLLWRHGMLAYKKNSSGADGWRFCNTGFFDELELPQDASLYGLHSCLLDLYGDLKSTSGGPVF